MRFRLALGSLLALAVAAPGGAQTGDFARFRGGGRAATDCMLVTDVAGASGRRLARCTDGDPTCDGDGAADGVCRFTVRLCLGATSPALPRCHRDIVTAVAVDEPALAHALDALPMPVATPETCTDAVDVPVTRRGRRGRLVLRGSARMASGHADRDRVALVCRRPAAPGATFATLQRRIFTPGCATASCHGAAGAGGLRLTAGQAHTNLVGVSPANASARDRGLLRVAPGDLERSFLVRKLEGSLLPADGERMPPLGAPPGPAAIDLVRRWILAGASPDAPF